ncbi:MAG: HD domain-containing protein [Balneolaceae bacterium]|nr:HD domain-containing protein [Balneolaceae bacterium]MBO6546262.1 HD domain-containing protein [Balneolaceae bacterium]MBO6648621.1 HD domain-containing protein [Balneolaceae bacterium]
MKDVKSYFNLVGNRLGKAFSIREFDTEDELEFWSLSAEHMSRAKPPSFQDIVQWMDILYKAPVHVVYKKEVDELVLFKRFINVQNLIGKDKSSNYTDVEKEAINNFEQQVQNLQQKIQWYPDLNEHGISSTSIGNCEHIPLFDENREVWGLYIVGPDSKCPEVIVPRLSIVGRLLSIWLINIEKEEIGQRNKYRNKMEEIVSELGSGALNTEGLARFFLRFLLNGFGCSTGAVIEYKNENPMVVFNEGIEEEKLALIAGELAKSTPKDNSVLDINGVGKTGLIPFKGDLSKGWIVTLNEGGSSKLDMESIGLAVSNQVAKLLDFRDENDSFTKLLIDTYYQMLRAIERSRDKTEYHTPRMIAFVERFAMIFGLDENETNIIKTTAKLHDIGYVGSVSVEKDISIGSELSHPLTGYKLIDQLPIHEDIKQGVLTHQEWVSGDGSPRGLSAEEISWTGKVIGIFEYIVEFIESNKNDNSKSADEWIDQLTQSIIERADQQFDMVLVPTVIELIKMMGWELCCQLGTDD